jgi:general secretion pathway protein D
MRFLICLTIAVVLSGCAAQRSFREGQALIDQGRTEEGLVKLQEAIRNEPRNAEYRTTFLLARDRLTQDINEQGERALAAGRIEEALRHFQRVLMFDANNTRARSGLLGAERVRRHMTLLEEAKKAYAAKDAETAIRKLREILTENPDHAGARELQRTIAEARARPIAPSALAEALQKPVTIEFRDAPLRQIFEVLARTSGLNFVFDRDVRVDARTTVFLRNATVESVVNLVLLTNQLERRVIDANTIVIYPNTPAKVREYQQLVVRSFLLSTADAKQVANSIRTIVRTRDVVIDEKLNMIVVRDSPEAVRMAEKLVLLHDAPEPEVMLEVEILEVKRSRLLELGVRWPGQLSLSPLPTADGDTLTLEDLRGLNSRRIGVGIDPIVIQAQKTDTDTNLLANPRIRARNKEKAKILIGDRLPTITSTSTATGFVSESVSYIDVGLKLEVEPTVHLDGDVAIKISLEVSNIVNQIQTTSGTLAYQLGTRSASTTLRLKDGENQVLAGLIQDDERKSAARVPGLGDVPIVGRLFGAQTDDNSKTEIVLSITPRLIRNVQRPDAILAEFDAGTEASLRADGVVSGVRTAPRTPSPVAPGLTPRTDGSTPTEPTSPDASTPSTTSTTGTAATSTLPSTAVTGTSIAAARTSWQGPDAVRVGESFSLQLFFQSDTPVASLPMTIGFDSKVLQVVAVTEGDFLKQGGASTSFTSRVDASGQVLITATRAPTAGSGATALASAVTVTFRALTAAEDTRVSVASITPISMTGGSIVVTQPPPHELQVTEP